MCNTTMCVYTQSHISDVGLEEAAVYVCVCICVQALELQSIVSHHWEVIGCSAVTGEQLLTGMNWLTEDISARVFTMD